MARAIWSGAISFGLVNIPVKLTTAVRRQSVSFREIRKSDGSRIRHRKVAENDGAEVDYEEIAKGYEIAPDRYVVIDPEELKALDPKGSRTIEIEEFVDLDDIDPIYYDSQYYLVPTAAAAKPYKLLLTAMEESGKVAIARFVLRTKQYLAAIRPLDGALGISTMVYADEVIGTDKLEELPGEDIEVSERELEMARQLIASLAGKWDPEQYRDQYRERVLELIEQKAEGQEIVTVPDEERTAGEVVDLMAALEASLEAAKRGDAAETA